MALFRRSSEPEDPTQLVLRKEYKRAIELYRAGLKKQDDPNDRLRLADALVLDGQQAEAIREYKQAAATYAERGFLLKAIGVNKKIVKLDPSQEDVHNQLSQLYEEKGLLASRPSGAPVKPAPAKPETPAPEELPMDVSVDALADALADQPSDAEIDVEALDALDLAPELSEPEAPPSAGFTYRKTPLFSDFTADEFVDVVKQMSQETYSENGVIVNEGDPGDALFVIVDGAVRVLTNARGKTLQLAELGEGDFFGEGSLITGRPRTATVVAARQTELLKLDRAGFEDVVSRYPRVKDVMLSFYKQRAESTVQSILKHGKS